MKNSKSIAKRRKRFLPKFKTLSLGIASLLFILILFSCKGSNTTKAVTCFCSYFHRNLEETSCVVTNYPPSGTAPSIASRLQLQIMSDSRFQKWGESSDAFFCGDTVPLKKTRDSLENLRFIPAPWIPEIQHMKVQLSDRTIPIRIYIPRFSTRTPPPILYYIHGGGFIVGSPTVGEAFCRFIAFAGGASVVSVDYRLSPEFPYPAALNDIVDIYQKIPTLSQLQKSDTGVIFLAGDSAGGNLAAALTVRIAEEKLFKPKGMILIYPVLDFTASDMSSIDRFSSGYGLTPSLLLQCKRAYLSDPEQANFPTVSPLFAPDSAFTSALVVTSEFDPLRRDGERFAVKLQNAKIPCYYHCLKGSIHGFLSNPANPAFYAMSGLTIQFIHKIMKESAPALKESSAQNLNLD